MYFLTALGLFVYQSLDAIDGKQARRTGTSSPLGELFDHGCDSVSTGNFMFSFNIFFMYLF
jgi:phosphatidylglycerophosphate synthase